jgi:hypothetical protein
MQTSTKWVLGGLGAVTVLWLFWPKPAQAAGPAMAGPLATPGGGLPPPVVPVDLKTSFTLTNAITATSIASLDKQRFYIPAGTEFTLTLPYAQYDAKTNPTGVAVYSNDLEFTGQSPDGLTTYWKIKRTTSGPVYMHIAHATGEAYPDIMAV